MTSAMWPTNAGLEVIWAGFEWIWDKVLLAVEWLAEVVADAIDRLRQRRAERQRG